MIKLAKRIGIVLSTIGICIIGTVIAMNTMFKETPTTVLALTTDPSEDINVGVIAFETIREEVAITSKAYDFSFFYEKGALAEEAGFWDKTKHVLAGKSIRIEAFLGAELRSNLLALQEQDITYDSERKTLSIVLPSPQLIVHLNKEKTGIDNYYEAFFSSGYSAEEQLRMYGQIELLGTEKFIIEQPELVKQAEQDIINGLTFLLTSIPTVENVTITFVEH